MGFILLARGLSAPDGLHVAYGIAPLVISLVSEGMRAGVAQRELDDVPDVDALERADQVRIARRVALGEMGVMTVGALLILTLALRAYQTAARPRAWRCPGSRAPAVLVVDQLAAKSSSGAS